MLEGFQFTSRGVIIGKTYIVSDLHIGYHTRVDSMKVEDETNEIYERIDNVVGSKNIDRIILNGDIFHEFGEPNESSLRAYNRLVSYIKNKDVDVVPIEGNHDTDSVSTVEKTRKKVELVYNSNRYLVTHGHKRVTEEKPIDCYILGHIHPVYRIRGIEWPIYLYGSNEQSKKVFITPCFSSHQDGVLISSNTNLDIDFPYVSDFSSMRPAVYNESKDEVDILPPIGEIDKYY